MDNRDNKKVRPAPVEVRCSNCDTPLYVCEECLQSILGENDAHCPEERHNQQAVPQKTGDEEKPQGAVGNCESSFLTMLRKGGKMLEKVTKNVASTTDNLFRVEGWKKEDEEDIDRLVAEFKKAQLEEQEKK